MAGEPAYNAGLKQGDVVTRIDDREVHKWSDLQKIVAGADLRPLKFEIERTGPAHGRMGHAEASATKRTYSAKR